MSLRSKLLLISMGAVAITASACLWVQRSVIRRQGIELTYAAMRGVLLSAENARESISAMRTDGVFRPNLVDELAKGGDFRKAKVYQTVPVVAAWKAIEMAAQKESYAFHIAARNPRNRANEPRAEDEDLLRQLEAGAAEAALVDEDRNEIVFARPIRLTRDCLSCHGDPAQSPKKDGRDALGFPMENWREGQIHGAFVLRSSLDRLSPVIRAEMARTIAWVIPLALLVGIAVYIFIARLGRTMDRLAAAICEISANTDAAAGQMASASESLASSATQEAAAIQETTTSSERVHDMARRNAEHACTATGLATESEDKSNSAATTLETMVRAIDEIGAQSDRISKVIKVVDEIAFQTNLLALNAAVEAARAGAAGSGFAVVADEVRRLAQRCAGAARETSDLIGESISKSKSGRLHVEGIVEAIGVLRQSSARVKVLVKQVSDGSNEQARAVQEIAGAMGEIEHVNHRTAAAAEETAAAAAELRTQSATLKEIVRDLDSLVGGRSS